MKALFESINLIGDALYISPALRSWITKQEQPVEVYLHTLNDHIAPLYRGMVEDMLQEDPDDRPRHLKTFVTCFKVLDEEFDFRWRFDVGEAFQLSHHKRQHLAHSYADLLGVDIPHTKEGINPVFIPYGSLDDSVQDLGLKGCVLISMFSASCSSRGAVPQPPNKMLPWIKWPMMLNELRRSYPSAPIRILGAPTDTVPEEMSLLCHTLGIEPMFGIPLNRLALIMQKAALLVTIDNGMSHLAASQKTPTFLMYPQCLSPYYICPVGNPNMVYVQINPVTVQAAYLHQALQFAIRRLKEKKQ